MRFRFDAFIVEEGIEEFADSIVIHEIEYDWKPQRHVEEAESPQKQFKRRFPWAWYPAGESCYAVVACEERNERNEQRYSKYHEDVLFDVLV